MKKWTWFFLSAILLSACGPQGFESQVPNPTPVAGSQDSSSGGNSHQDLAFPNNYENGPDTEIPPYPSHSDTTHSSSADNSPAVPSSSPPAIPPEKSLTPNTKKPEVPSPTTSQPVAPTMNPAPAPLPSPVPVPTPVPAETPVPSPASPIVTAPPLSIPQLLAQDDADSRGLPPLHVFSEQLAKKFKTHLDVGQDYPQLSAEAQNKWSRIYAEIRRAADVRTDGHLSLLKIDSSQAVSLSIRFENTGQISPTGAWTIALQGTAARHGFENTPCAEFMSEVVREAYQRAGYSILEDFSKANGNPLIFSDTASVVGLGWALLKAGWSVWDISKYRPPMGAILVHEIGDTPGHTYMAAGIDGNLIMDNNSPGGRDLRKSRAKLTEYMYDTGAFYLPPGVIPKTWSGN